MIRRLQNTDTKQVMQIWLNGNREAHPFVPKEFWESNFEMVQLPHFILERAFRYYQKDMMKLRGKANIR